MKYSFQAETILLVGLLLVQALLNTSAEERHGASNQFHRRGVPTENVFKQDEKTMGRKVREDARVPSAVDDRKKLVGEDKNIRDDQQEGESRDDVIDELVKILYDEKHRNSKRAANKESKINLQSKHQNAAQNKKQIKSTSQNKEKIKKADHEVTNIPKELLAKEEEDTKTEDYDNTANEALKTSISNGPPGIWGKDVNFPSLPQQVSLDKYDDDERLDDIPTATMVETIYKDFTTSQLVGPPGLYSDYFEIIRQSPQLYNSDSNNKIRGALYQDSAERRNGPPGLWGREITDNNKLTNKREIVGPPGLWGKREEDITEDQVKRKSHFLVSVKGKQNVETPVELSKRRYPESLVEHKTLDLPDIQDEKIDAPHKLEKKEPIHLAGKKEDTSRDPVFLHKRSLQGPPGLYSKRTEVVVEDGKLDKRGPPGLWGRRDEENKEEELKLSDDKEKIKSAIADPGVDYRVRKDKMPDQKSQKDSRVQIGSRAEKDSIIQKDSRVRKDNRPKAGRSLRWREIISQVKDILQDEQNLS